MKNHRLWLLTQSLIMAAETPFNTRLTQNWSPSINSTQPLHRVCVCVCVCFFLSLTSLPPSSVIPHLLRPFILLFFKASSLFIHLSLWLLFDERTHHSRSFCETFFLSFCPSTLFFLWFYFLLDHISNPNFFNKSRLTLLDLKEIHQLFFSFCYLPSSWVPDRKIGPILSNVRTETRKKWAEFTHC